jgi:hypothetical protein
MDASGVNAQSGQHFMVPSQIVSPPSRSDNGSASSTVYAVHYHNLTSPSPDQHLAIQQPLEPQLEPAAPKPSSESGSSPSEDDKDLVLETAKPTGRNIWHAVQNPFKKRKAEPPAQVAVVQSASGMRRSPIDRRFNLRDRFGAFAAAQRDKLSGRPTAPAAALPVTVIPAPRAEGRTWSPDDVQDPSPKNDAADTEARSASVQLQIQSHQVAPPLDANQVVFIPVPTPGRTWSPDDAHLPPPQSSCSTAPLVVAPITPTRSYHPTQPVYTTRGALTFSETDPRSGRNGEPSSPASRRSPTFARSPTFPPIAEQPTREDSGSQAAHNDETPGASSRQGSEESVVAEINAPAIRPATETPPALASTGSPGARDSQTDGRDTGGT